MSNIERVEPTNVNDIELYVSKDGLQSGMSQSGLARLCGISEAALRKCLGDRTKLATICSKPAAPDDLYLVLSSTQQAKVIDSQYASKVVEHYAFDSSNKTRIALFSFRRFASLGMDTWIKQSVGYIETHGQIDQRLYDLLAVMGGDIKAMKADLASTSGYRAARVTLPGLKEWMESLSDRDLNQLALPTNAGEQLFTLVEWASADQDGLVLSKGQKHALANLVSSTYKAMSLEMPEKVSRHNEKGYKLAAVQAYPCRHFALIRMCFSRIILK